MYEFMSQLSESKLFPTVLTLEKLSEKECAERTLLYLCSLRILLAEEGSHDWARAYSRKTAQWSHFDKWRNNATDLYVLLSSINGVNTGEDWTGYGLSRLNVLNWLKAASLHEPDESQTRRLFVKLDFDLKIHNEALRGIRRLTMNWHRIDLNKKKLVMTRLIQLFRTRMRNSELLTHLEIVARKRNLRLSNENPDGAIID